MIQDQGPQYTPPNYMPPDQLALQKEYAAALMKGGQRDKEITSPWQGVRMMADTLAGRHLQNQAGQQQASNTFGAGQEVASAPRAGAPQGGMDPYTARTFKLESGNDPNARTGSNVGLGQFGPEEMKRFGITNPSDPDQQISGLHQERSANVQGLTKALGRPPTPGEEYLAHQQGLAGATTLLTNPNMPAWQAIRKYYPSDAIAQRAIAGNPPGGGHFDPNAPAGHFTGAWVKQFEGRLGPQSGAGGQTADLSGSIGGSGPPQIGSPQAMSGALAANTAPHSGGPLPGGPPVSGAGGATLGPEYAPQRTHIPQDQMGRILGNQWIPPEIRNSLFGQYQQEYQPVELKTTGGRTIFPGGGSKGPGIDIPDLQHFNLKSGGAEAPGFGTIRTGPGGETQFSPTSGLEKLLPGNPTVQQPSSNPAGLEGLPDLSAPKTTPGPQGSAAPMPGQAATAAMAANPMGQQGPAPIEAPPTGAKTALATPGNVGSDAPPIGGMLGTPPPQAQAAPRGVQTAQQGQPQSLLGGLQQMDLDQERRKEFIKTDVKSFNDSYDKINASSQQSVQSLPTIGIAREALNRAYTGIGADVVQDFNRVKAALGNDQKAAASFDIFQKTISESLLNEMRAKLQGLGQVRNAEIDIMKRATAGPYNTRAANNAVLDIIEAELKQQATLGQIATAYNSGARWNKGKWAQTNETPTNAGLNEVTRQYLVTHPTFTTEQIKEFDRTFNMDEKAAKPPTAEDKLGDFYSSRPPAGPSSPSIQDKIDAAQQQLQRLQGR